MAGTIETSTINVISPNGLVTKAITASDTGHLNVPSPQFADAINLTSGQIKFPATQVPSADANTLDDYEEGTWTPFAVSGQGSITTQASFGKYIKIGRCVTVTGLLSISNNGTGAGSVTVTLPFAANSNCNSAGVGRLGGTTGEICSVIVPENSSQAGIWKYNNAYPFANGAFLDFSLTYFTA